MAVLKTKPPMTRAVWLLWFTACQDQLVQKSAVDSTDTFVGSPIDSADSGHNQVHLDTSDSASDTDSDTSQPCEGDPSLSTEDADMDGFSPCDGDCDDTDSMTHPNGQDSLAGDHNCDGRIDINLSTSDHRLYGEAVEDEAGVAMTAAGDVDGDGKEDVLIASFHNDEGGKDAGKTYLVTGASLEATQDISLGDLPHAFVGENAGDESGFSVAGRGDVDGDGLDDMLIGVPYNATNGYKTGKSYLIRGADVGGTTLLENTQDTFVGTWEGGQSGYDVAILSDIDGDARDDVLIGAPLHSGKEQAGAAMLFRASALTGTTMNLEQATHTLTGEFNGDLAGLAVKSAGDVDGALRGGARTYGTREAR